MNVTRDKNESLTTFHGIRIIVFVDVRLEGTQPLESKNLFFLSKRYSQYCLTTRGLTRHIIVNPPYMSCRLCISVRFRLKAFSLSK